MSRQRNYSKYNKYGNHSSRHGAESSPWNSSCVLDIRPPCEDIYARIVEIAEGLMRKSPEMCEDYAMEKAAEILGKKDELFR